MADSRIPGSNSMCECSTAASTAPLIYAIPDDLIKTILQRLGASDLCHVASCCRWLRDATNQDSLWRPLCQSKGWEHYGTTTDLAKIASYGPSEQAADASEAGDDSVTFQKDRIVTDDNTAGLTSTCRWKGVYMRAYHLDRNWATNSSYSNTFYLDVEKNPNPQHRIVLVDGDLLSLHNFEEAIQVFDIRKKTLQCVIPTIKPAGLGKFKDGVIVVPFESGVACAFEARTGKLLQTIDGKWRYERVLLFFDGELVITYVRTFRGVDSKKFRNIYVWCVKDGKLRRILKLDPTDDVGVCYNVDYRDRMVAAALDDDYIRVWDVRSGECLHKLKCPGKNSKVQLVDNVIVGFSTNGDVCVTSIWSQDTGECQKMINVGLTDRGMRGYTAEMVNNLILMQFSTRCCTAISSVYAYNLNGELVTKVERNFYAMKGNGRKRLFYQLHESEEGKGSGDDGLSVTCEMKLTEESSRREYESRKRVIFNITPIGLVPLFDASPAQLIGIDEIRMILCDNKEHRILIHHYW
ncbi:uncharacterized protein LOC119735483 [Patiria miniata]|uniref:F-box domain-containing protein n=1 Tax=Patiria miniata TaxID=46514 RepID=A0A914ANP7_PATMI|nr:uncharacterized protein LOC119735483 [Patiria miniata]